MDERWVTDFPTVCYCIIQSRNWARNPEVKSSISQLQPAHKFQLLHGFSSIVTSHCLTQQSCRWSSTSLRFQQSVSMTCFYHYSTSDPSSNWETNNKLDYCNSADRLTEVINWATAERSATICCHKHVLPFLHQLYCLPSTSFMTVIQTMFENAFCAKLGKIWEGIITSVWTQISVQIFIKFQWLLQLQVRSQADLVIL